MKLPFENRRYIVSIFLTIFITFFGQNFAYGNNAPVFTDGASTTRTVAENTASRENIGSAVAATDADNDTLTYNLSGTDAASFSIVRTSGQLQTNVALDYETDASYSVTVDVSDGNGGSDSIPVTISVKNVNEKPYFAPGGVILSVAENTASGTNIGDPFQATDPDSGDTLTYSLQRGDKNAFRIDPNTGQLRTHAALDYETKRFYTDLAVRATDSTGLVGSVRVTINVKDVAENTAPVFSDGSSTTRTIAENTASGENIGAPVAATDVDANNDTLTYTLGGDPDAAAFSIVRTTGQLQTRAALDYETKPSYAVSVSVSDGNGGSDSITVTIDVTDVPEITPPLSERTPQVRDAIIAKLPGISNAKDVTPAHLAVIRELDVSNKKISALKTGDFNGLTALSRLELGWNSLSDISALAGLTSLTELLVYGNALSDISVLSGLTSLRQLFLGDNSISNISAVAGLTSLTRLDLHNNSLSDISALARLTSLTTLHLGDNSLSDISVLSGLTSLTSLRLNNNSIRDVSALEDLTSLTHLYLKGNPISEYGPLRRLKAAIDAIEGHRGLTLDITIPEVRSPNNAPVFTDGATTTRSVAENTASGENIGAAIAATDADTDDTLIYTLGGTDAGAFRIVSSSGQLQTSAALDYETKALYTVSVSVSDGNGGSDNIPVTINVKDVAENTAPVFSDGASTTRSIAENTASGQNIGTAITATDADNDTLIYTLGGTPDVAMFSINGTTGQLQTKAALDYETKTSYSVSVSVSDGKGGSDSITVTINVKDVDENRAPVFSDGASTTRSIAENTASGQNIGAPLAATDADNDTLIYTLGGNTDAASFRIVSTTGQLQTQAALDYETKSSYAVTVSVSDSKGGSDSITVTVHVRDVTEITPPLSERTPQVRNAIVAAVRGVNNANDVTVAHLAAITSLNLSSRSIRSLKTGDFNGLTALATLDLNTNAISDISALEHLTSLIYLFLSGNSITDISALERLTSLRHLYLSNNSIRNISALEHLTALTHLYLLGNSITDISALERLTSLRHLYLHENSISDISALENLTALTRLSLNKNRISDISALEHLTSLIGLNLSHNSISGISALEHLTALTSLSLHNNSIRDISALEGLTSLKQLDLGKNAIRDISVLEGLTSPVSLNLWKNSISDVSALEGLTSLRELFLGGNSISDYGPLRRLKAAIAAIASHQGFFLDITIPEVTNNAPVFTDGGSAARSVAENTASGENIEAAIAATDVDTGDTLTYTLTGTDAGSFGIVSTSGQLQTRAALDYETKTSYAVTVSVSDSKGGSDSIPVTINVSNVNEKPYFAPGGVILTVAENTASGTNIGEPITATDPDSGDTLTYSLQRGDKEAFSIDTNTGQVKTLAALDYETKNAYTDLAVRATDSTGLIASTLVRINVTDVDENNAPVFSDGSSTTRSVVEQTSFGVNIGSAVAATDADPEDVLTYSLGGTDAASFIIVSTSGQLQTNAALDYETKTSYSVTLSVSDGNGGSDSIPATIHVLNANEPPTFTEGSRTTRAIAENTASGENIGDPVAATDVDANTTLTYTLGGTDADSFSIVSTSGQLQTNTALDYETKISYSVTVSVSDDNGASDSITVTINVKDVNENRAPVFTDGASATRSVAEHTAINTNIGMPVAATDADYNRLAYTLGGTDADSFSIGMESGQLLTGAALDYETKTSYSVTVSVSDGNGGSDSIDVTINVTNVNEAPSFASSTATRSVAENTTSGENIGDPVAATDVDRDDTLIYTLSGTDASSFSIVSTTGQLQTNVALDYQIKTSYSVTITVSDGSLTDRIDVTINVTEDGTENNAPVFTDGISTTRTIAENTAANTNIGAPVAATDADNNDTLTYTLSGTDAASFSIGATTGQLQTNAALDYETKTSYSVTVSVSDGNGGSDIIPVTINVANVNESPTFTESGTAFRSIAENTAAGQNIGTPIAATDEENDTLTYVLSGQDAALFSIVSTTGQLQTKAALDYETGYSGYGMTVSVHDGNTSNNIQVAIRKTDVNEKPYFADGGVTLTVAENAAAGRNIETPITATDPDRGDTLTYSLQRGDKDAFRIDPNTGQIRTHAALDYETKKVYTDLVVRATDSAGLIGSTRLTINVYKSNSPVFTEGTSTTRSIAENTAAGTNVGAPITATDADNDTLRYSALSATGGIPFRIGPTTGQLQTTKILDYETQSSYSVIVYVSDGSTDGRDRIAVTINVNDVDETNNTAPVFTEGYSTTLTVFENTPAGRNIGTPFTATDVDNNPLTYTLGGTDAAAFSFVSTTQQLQTKAALDYETKTSYSVTITVSDGSLTDSIGVTINVTNVNDPPMFTDGTSTTRDIAENTPAGVNIGAPVAATDIEGETLTYYPGFDWNSPTWSPSPDWDVFSLDSTSGQIRTKAPLDFEMRSTYYLNVGVYDETGLHADIAVTINVTDVGENVPVFTEGTTTTRSVAENTASGTNIGTPVTATDADNDTLTYSLGGIDAASFSIVSTTGQLQTKAALDYGTKSSYSVTVLVYDGNNGGDGIVVTINVRDMDGTNNTAPVFTDGTTTTRSVAERTAPGTNIGSVVAATDADNDTLTYSLGGTDAAVFRIVSTTGQLQTSALLDYETDTSYSVTVSVSDGNSGTDSIAVTINVNDVDETNNTAPVFTDGTTTTRSVAENVPLGTSIGRAVSATDADNDTLTYSLYAGLDSMDGFSFSIDSTTGQLRTKYPYLLDYETKSSYSVTVLVSDGNGGGDSITVTINVRDGSDTITPSLSTRTPTVRDAIVAAVPGVNNANDVTLSHLTAITSLNLSGKSIRSLKTGDFNGLLTLSTLHLNRNSISDLSALDHLTALTSLNLSDNLINDISALDHLTALTSLNLSDNLISDISALDDLTALTSLNLSDNLISDISALDHLTALTSLNLSDNLISDISALDDLTALTSLNLSDNLISDISTLQNSLLRSLYLSDNSISDVSALQNLRSLTSLSIKGNPISDYEPLRILKGSNSGIHIDINLDNNPPVFTDGSSTTRSIAENTVSGTNIGDAVAATDADNDTLTYSLGGTDAASFSIVNTTGQLQTSAALDFETKTSYTVTVDASDGNDGLDRITVTITVTDEAAAAPSVELPPVIPMNTALLTNFPNPFNPETWIPYQLAEPAEVTLTIYDVRGVVVRRLDLGQQLAGVYHSRSRAIHWDGRNGVGEKVASGLYFYTLTAGDFTATRKLLIRK